MDQLQNELNRACFQHDMAYEDFKDLTGRTTSDKILRDKTFNIATNPKYDMAAVLKIKSFLITN